VGLGGVLLMQHLLRTKTPSTIKASKPDAVTALGRIMPRDGLINLSIPAGVGSMNEVVDQWYVDEGQAISKGQVLARLSSWQQLLEVKKQQEANLTAVKAQLPFLEISLQRGTELYLKGGITEQDLGRIEASLLTRKADIQAAEAQLSLANERFKAANIKSPIDGKIIRIYSWPGMKETADGLALLAKTGEMQVWAQVYQSDIRRVSIGQAASIKAENNGFAGNIQGRVRSIIGEVSSRDLFATTANNNVNARVILTKIDIEPQYIKQIQALSGMNVIINFLTK